MSNIVNADIKTICCNNSNQDLGSQFILAVHSEIPTFSQMAFMQMLIFFVLIIFYCSFILCCIICIKDVAIQISYAYNSHQITKLFHESKSVETESIDKYSWISNVLFFLLLFVLRWCLIPLDY